jgi:hypothetical protein
MARLCPPLNDLKGRLLFEKSFRLEYLEQNHSVVIYKHVFKDCQILRTARRRAVTPEHHTTDGCVWLLSISLILGW